MNDHQKGSEEHLEQRDDVLIIFDVCDAHTHHSRQRVHHNLIVERMRIVLQLAELLSLGL